MTGAVVVLAILAIAADWYTTKRALLDAPLGLRERNGAARWVWARLGIPRGSEAAFQARALWGLAILDGPSIAALCYMAPRAPAALVAVVCGAVAGSRFRAAWSNRRIIRRARERGRGPLDPRVRYRPEVRLDGQNRRLP